LRRYLLHSGGYLPHPYILRGTIMFFWAAGVSIEYFLGLAARDVLEALESLLPWSSENNLRRLPYL
jgi:hypothetical protein